MLTERLKKMRKEHGYKQLDIADKIGTGRTTYAKYETGDIQPPIDQVIRLSDLFDVSVDYLLGKSNDRTSPNAKKSDIRDPDIIKIQRARENLGPVDREKMMKLLMLTFEEAFPKEKNDNGKEQEN